MQLEFQNLEFSQVKQFIDGLKMSGAKTNRARYSLSQILAIKIKEIEEEKIEMSKEYCRLNTDGSIKVDDSGKMIFKDTAAKVAQGKAFTKMMTESSAITVDDYVDQLKKFYKFLDSYSDELFGNDDLMFGLLLDKFEDAGLDK